jgi:hypothetical protein
MSATAALVVLIIQLCSTKLQVCEQSLKYESYYESSCDCKFEPNEEEYDPSGYNCRHCSHEFKSPSQTALCYEGFKECLLTEAEKQPK